MESFIDCYALYWLSDHLSTILKARATHTRKLNTKSISSKTFTYTKHALLLVLLPFELFSAAIIEANRNVVKTTIPIYLIPYSRKIMQFSKIWQVWTILKEDLVTLPLLQSTNVLT